MFFPHVCVSFHRVIQFPEHEKHMIVSMALTQDLDVVPAAH